MSDETALAVSFGVAFLLTLALTPLGVTPPDPRAHDRLEPEVRVEESLA